MKSTLKKLLPFAVVGVISGATTVGTLQYFGQHSNNGDQSYFTSSPNASFVGMNTSATGDDFVKAAKTTVPAVVTIKNYQSRTTSRASEQDLLISSSVTPSEAEEEASKSKDSSSRLLIICHQEWDPV